MVRLPFVSEQNRFCLTLKREVATFGHCLPLVLISVAAHLPSRHVVTDVQQQSRHLLSPAVLFLIPSLLFLASLLVILRLSDLGVGKGEGDLLLPASAVALILETP